MLVQPQKGREDNEVYMESPEQAPQTTNTKSGGSYPAIAFDPSAYRDFLDGTDWTDEQKDEFTQELWRIVLGFVDLGFGIHPIQDAVEHSKTLDQTSPAMLASTEFSLAANEGARPGVDTRKE